MNEESKALTPGMKMITPLDGMVIAVDKPLGWSSFHVVKRLRGVLSTRLRTAGVKKIKVGHAGTLDPLATGVMLICTGKATKRIDELQSGVKEYVATLCLGATTPSFDLETPVDAIYRVSHITRQLVEEKLKQFQGRIEQIPPAYSACKVDGDRAYKMARRGEDVVLKAKTLVIDEIELLEYSQEEITIRVVCSKGTYIRALARDIGVALGSGAHLRALRRTRVGAVSLSEALPVDVAVKVLCEAPMQICDADGNVADVAQIEFHTTSMDKADIKPYAERCRQGSED